MTIIDARDKKLTIRQFKKFEENCSDDIIIYVDDECLTSTTKHDFRAVFLLKLFFDLDDSSKLEFRTTSCCFIMSIEQYKVWCDEWRASRIFADSVKFEKPSHHVRITYKDHDRELSDEVSSNNDKDLLGFINYMYARYSSMSMKTNGTIKFIVDDIEYSFDELVNQGKFILK